MHKAENITHAQRAHGFLHFFHHGVGRPGEARVDVQTAIIEIVAVLPIVSFCLGICIRNNGWIFLCWFRPAVCVACNRPLEITSNMANSSATRISGLYSAIELPSTTSTAFEVRGANAAAMIFRQGIRLNQVNFTLPCQRCVTTQIVALFASFLR